MNVPKGKVERSFYLSLVELSDGIAIRNDDRDRLMARKESQFRQATEARQKLDNEVKRVVALQGALAVKAADGTLPDEVVKAQIKELEYKRTRLAADLVAIPLPARDFEQALHFSEMFVAALPRHWETGALTTKKHIQRFFFEHGATVNREGTIGTAEEGNLTGSGEVFHIHSSSVVPQTDEPPNYDSSTKQTRPSRQLDWFLIYRIFAEFGSVTSAQMNEHRS
jgi:hypothetical protein